MKESSKELVSIVKEWFEEARKDVLHKLTKPMDIEEKSSRSDLVTNVDKETEAFFVSKIRQAFPDDRILGEEGLGDVVDELSGRVWVIDPIDGTLNFIKQQDYFAMMLAVYVEGVGQLGFIYEVMRDRFLYGGPEIGVYHNGKKIEAPNNIGLADGLIGMNSHMLINDTFHAVDIAKDSVGIRMWGCAGIEFIELILGTQNGYLSNLAPWDFAPGKIMAEALGLVVTTADGKELTPLSRGPILAATPKTHEDIMKKHYK